LYKWKEALLSIFKHILQFSCYHFNGQKYLPSSTNKSARSFLSFFCLSSVNFSVIAPYISNDVLNVWLPRLPPDFDKYKINADRGASEQMYFNLCAICLFLALTYTEKFFEDMMASYSSPDAG